MTLLARLNRFPPALCRLVARSHHGRRGLTRAAIIRESGLSAKVVDRLSRMHSWNGVRLSVADAFSRACGVNLLATRRHVEWLKRYRKTAWRGREKLVAQILRDLQKARAGR